jgi:hypothetical protein
MIEKLKALGEAARNFILFILTPVAAVVGMVLWLFIKNKKLEQELVQTKAEDDAKISEAGVDVQASDAVGDYERLLAEYQGSKPAQSPNLPPSS